jgi:hypothetical protein
MSQLIRNAITYYNNGDFMPTGGEQIIINWLRKTTIGTMKQIRHQFHVSHMTVVRALKKFGYYASYNYNAAYYVLFDVPEFDDWGLWTYRNIHFSRFRTLPATIVALVEKAPAGLTTDELERRLQTKASNVVSRLASQNKLHSERLAGHHVVYLANESAVRNSQLDWRQRQMLEEAASSISELPSRCSASDVIKVLQAVILTTDDDPNRLAWHLQAGGVHITAGQVRRVLERYEVKKKRRT